MVCGVKGLAALPDHLNSLPGIQMVEGESQLQQAVLWSYKHAVAQACQYTDKIHQEMNK